MRQLAILIFCLVASAAVWSETPAYTIRPGDLLRISVWGDDTLDRTLRVLPDGSLSFPLVGHVSTTGKSIEELREVLHDKIAEFIAEPEVSVLVIDTYGSQIYVLGNVNSPGSFQLMAPMTVVRALAMAGGLNAFADTNDIRIIRGESPSQTILKVNYDELLTGKDLSSNYSLQAGDTLLVP